VRCGIRQTLLMVLMLLLSLVWPPDLALTRDTPNEPTVICLVGEHRNSSHPTTLLIVAVEYDGESVPLNRPFAASSDWLRRISIRIRNESFEPIVYIALKVGLLHRDDDVASPRASWQHGVVYVFGEQMRSEKGGDSETRLAPGEEIVLSSSQIAPPSFEALESKGDLGRFRRAEIWGGEARFASGKFQSGGVGFLRGPKTSFDPPPN
jgi:hypothetical protein